MTAECGVAAVVVVGVKEVCQGLGEFVVAGVGPQAQALSVSTRSMRVMPCAWQNAAARVRKSAQVATFSSEWISL